VPVPERPQEEWDALHPHEIVKYLLFRRYRGVVADDDEGIYTAFNDPFEPENTDNLRAVALDVDAWRTLLSRYPKTPASLIRAHEDGSFMECAEEFTASDWCPVLQVHPELASVARKLCKHTRPFLKWGEYLDFVESLPVVQ
jgi:hypothetical protein